jgi:hypothetical protein
MYKLIFGISFLAVSCNLLDNQVYHSLGASRSIKESKDVNAFIAHLELVSLDNCNIQDQKINSSWYEISWKRNLGINSIEKLEFKNFFFETEIEYREKRVVFFNLKTNKRQNSIYSVEPIRGYKFIVDENVNLKDIVLEITTDNEVCQYKLINKEEGIPPRE